MSVLPLTGGNIALQGLKIDSAPLTSRAGDPGPLSERRCADGEGSSRFEDFQRNLHVQVFGSNQVSSHMRHGSRQGSISSQQGSPSIGRSPVQSRHTSKEPAASRGTSKGSPGSFPSSRVSSKENTSRNSAQTEISGSHGPTPGVSPAPSRRQSEGRSFDESAQPSSIFNFLHRPGGDDMSELQRNIARARADRYRRPQEDSSSLASGLDADRPRIPSSIPPPGRNPAFATGRGHHASKPGLLMHCLREPNDIETSPSAPSAQLSFTDTQLVTARSDPLKPSPRPECVPQQEASSWPSQSARKDMAESTSQYPFDASSARQLEGRHAAAEPALQEWRNAKAFLVSSLAFIQDSSDSAGQLANAVLVQQINRLFEAGKRVLFITNSPDVSRKSYADQLVGAGIRPACNVLAGDEHLSEAIVPHVVSVGSVAGWLLKQLGRKKPFVVTSSIPFLSDLQRAGVEDVVSTIDNAGTTKDIFLQHADQSKINNFILSETSGVDAVIISKDQEFTAMKWIVAAQLSARSQLPLMTCLTIHAKRKLHAMARGVACRALCDKPGFDGSEFDLKNPSDCFVAALLSPQSEGGYGIEAAQTVLLTSQMDDIPHAKALGVRSLFVAGTVDRVLMQASVMNTGLDSSKAPTWSIPDWSAVFPLD
eukprot:TRINITY_DN23269_c0_g1_i1.p1 TRINITY_DN23269_c0_g1~~TRINITY_DN23269_c0_g1_i1.p1  ORF type:complete len:652 (-),score=69.70 TRINITY_DN23269_c0_g1_i1:218-2173(-)